MVPIAGYEGLYSACESGRVWSHRSEKYLSPYRTKGRRGEGKYYRLALRVAGEASNQFVHKLIAKAFVPNPEGKPFVNHKNGDKLDNRPENLEWVTQSENQHHAYQSGLQRPNNGVKFRNNTSGFVGVTRSGKRWKAQIRVGGKLMYLGLYDTPEEASGAYQARLGTINAVRNKK